MSMWRWASQLKLSITAVTAVPPLRFMDIFILYHRKIPITLSNFNIFAICKNRNVKYKIINNIKKKIWYSGVTRTWEPGQKTKNRAIFHNFQYIEPDFSVNFQYFYELSIPKCEDCISSKDFKKILIPRVTLMLIPGQNTKNRFI